MTHEIVALLAAYMPALDRKAGSRGSRSWADLKRRLSELVNDHDGHIIDVVGDGWFVASFSNALQCTECAMNIQRGLNKPTEAPADPVPAPLHIGLNHEPSPVPGQVWPTASDESVDRLAALAEPGGICLSRTVYDEIRFQIDLPFDTTRDAKHTAYLCQEIRRKLNSLNLLESGAVRLGAAAINSHRTSTGRKDSTANPARRAFRNFKARF